MLPRTRFNIMPADQQYLELIKEDLSLPNIPPIYEQIMIGANGYLDLEDNTIVMNYHRNSAAIETLAHELKHYQQVLSNRLIRVKESGIIWEGKLYPIEVLNMARFNVDLYLNLPWEKEAYAYSDIFMHKHFGWPLPKEAENPYKNKPLLVSKEATRASA